MKNRYTLSILLIFFSMLAVGIVVAGFLLYQNQQQYFRKEVEDNLKTVADLKVSQVSMWRKDHIEEASVFYKNQAFARLVRQWLDHPENVSYGEDLTTWLDHFRESEQYNRVLLIDISGSIRLASPQSDSPLCDYVRERISHVIEGREVEFTDFYHDASNQPFISLLIPILDPRTNGETIAVLAMRIDPHAVLYPLLQRWPTPSQTAETELLRREGNEIVFLNELRFQENSATQLRRPLDEDNLPAIRASLEHEGLVKGIDYRGVPVLAAVRKVPDCDWYLVVKIDASEVFAPLRERLWQVVILVSGLLLGTALAVVGVWRQQLLAFYKKEHEINARMKAVTDAARNAIIMMDSLGRISYWNPAAESILGYTAAEALGKNLHLLIAPAKYHPRYFQAFPTFQRTGHGKVVGKTLEWDAQRKDGRQIPVSLSLSAIEIEGQWHAVGILRDESERKAAEETLRKNEAMRSCIINSIPFSVFWKDRQSVFLGCNQVFAAGAGLRPEDIVGKTDFDLPWTREESEAYRADDQQVIVSGLAKRHIIEEQHQPDGTQIWLDTTKMPLFDSEGFVYGVLGIYEDITERKKLEDALRQAKETAEEATQMKDQFLANMSHEMRTPMTSILGYSQLVLEEDIAPATREHVETIRRNGEHLLELINDILDLSKIEANKMQMEFVPCAPGELVRELDSLMRVRAEEKHLLLITESVGALPETIQTDPLRLRQILVNLMGNAIKFTEYGEVRLRVRFEAEPEPRIRFDVIDTGIGMDDEQIQRLFQPFMQVDSSSTRRFGGTGLGLCISERLAHALGGKIDVRSTPGKGSTFSLTIDPGPLDDVRMIENVENATCQDAPAGSSPAVVESVALHSRILLAEDGPDNQRLISLVLSKAGAQVSTVGNGQLAVDGALTAAEQGRPFDIVLMDMQMPVLDGYDATRRLRQKGYHGPIIALTAHAMSRDRQQCLDAGCDDYLSKPIRKKTLLEMVAKFENQAAMRCTCNSSDTLTVNSMLPSES